MLLCILYYFTLRFMWKVNITYVTKTMHKIYIFLIFELLTIIGYNNNINN
jgi:hypothetical protein